MRAAPSDRHRLMSLRPRERALYVILAMLVVAYYFRMLTSGQLPYMRDFFFTYLPWLQFSGQALREGHLPLWNSYEFCGWPFFAEIQTAVLYPFNVVYYLLPLPWAMRTSLTLHTFIALASMFGLCRQWRLSRAAACLAAISYAFGTFSISQQEYPTVSHTLAWAPLTFWLSSRAIQKWRLGAGKPARRRVARVVPTLALLTVVLTVQVLAGFPQAFGMSFAVLLLCAACEGMQGTCGAVGGGMTRGLVAALIMVCIAALFALSLSAPQLLASAEATAYSPRSEAIDPGYSFASLSPRNLLTLAIPFALGRPGYFGEWWGKTVQEFGYATAYVGLLPFMLAGVAFLVLRRRSPENLRRLFVLFGAIAIIGSLLSLGNNTPLYPFLYGHLPGFDRFRWPSRALWLFAMAMPVLGGIGYEALSQLVEEDQRLAKMVALAWPTLMTLVLCLGYLWARSGGVPNISWLVGYDALSALQASSILDDWAAACVFAIASTISLGLVLFVRRWRIAVHVVALGVLTVNLFWVSEQIQPLADGSAYTYQSPTTADAATLFPYRVHRAYTSAVQQAMYGCGTPRLYRWCKDILVGETQLPAHIFVTHGSGSLHPRACQELQDTLNALPGDQRDKLADLLSVRYMVVGPQAADVFAGKAKPDVRWVPRPSCLPRVLIVDRLHNVHTPEEALGLLVDPRYDPRVEGMVDMSSNEFERTLKELKPSNPPSPAGRLDAIRYDWNAIEMDTVVERPALLVLNEVWYPGWKAFVDGIPHTSFPANTFFQALWIQPGVHKIRLVYDPWPVKLGTFVAASALVVLSGCWLWAASLQGVHCL